MSEAITNAVSQINAGVNALVAAAGQAQMQAELYRASAEDLREQLTQTRQVVERHEEEIERLGQIILQGGGIPEHNRHQL